MTPNGLLQERGLQTARAREDRRPLVKRDRTRRIDQVIDYFGSAGRRTWNARSVSPGTGRVSGRPWRDARPSRAAVADWRAITHPVGADHQEGGVRWTWN